MHAERRKEIVKVYGIVVMLLCGLLTACATAPSDSEVQTPDERAIAKLIEEHVAAYNSQNTQALVAVYAPKAKIESVLAPGAIISQEQFVTMLDELGFQYKVFLRELNVKVFSEQLAEATAIFRLVDKEQNIILRRRYRFERFEGTWRILDVRFVGPVPQLLQRQK